MRWFDKSAAANRAPLGERTVQKNLTATIAVAGRFRRRLLNI